MEREGMRKESKGWERKILSKRMQGNKKKLKGKESEKGVNKMK